MTEKRAGAGQGLRGQSCHSHAHQIIWTPRFTDRFTDRIFNGNNLCHMNGKQICSVQTCHVRYRPNSHLSQRWSLTLINDITQLLRYISAQSPINKSEIIQIFLKKLTNDVITERSLGQNPNLSMGKVWVIEDASVEKLTTEL